MENLSSKPNQLSKSQKIGLLALISVFAFLSIACTSDTDTGKKTGESTTQKPTAETPVKPVIYKQEDIVEIDGTKQIISEVREYTSSSEFMTPDAGKRFLAIMINVENVSNSMQSYNPYDYSLKDKDGATYTGGYSDIEPLFSSGDLQPTMKAKGYLVYEIPVEMPTSNLQLFYTPLSLSSQQVVWQLN